MNNLKKIRINLLDKDKEKPFVNKFIYFLLHYLRYIVVITQIVVISVFFLRIIIDQEIIDLEEKIKEKQEIITISRSLLEEGERYDFAIDQVKTILSNQDKKNDNLNIIFSSIPKGVFLNNLTMTRNFISIDGFANDPFLVRVIHKRLVDFNGFKEVIVERIVKLNFNYQFTINVRI